MSLVPNCQNLPNPFCQTSLTSFVLYWLSVKDIYEAIFFSYPSNCKDLNCHASALTDFNFTAHIVIYVLSYQRFLIVLVPHKCGLPPYCRQRYNLKMFCSFNQQPGVSRTNRIVFNTATD